MKQRGVDKGHVIKRRKILFKTELISVKTDIKVGLILNSNKRKGKFRIIQVFPYRRNLIKYVQSSLVKRREIKTHSALATPLNNVTSPPSDMKAQSRLRTSKVTFLQPTNTEI